MSSRACKLSFVRLLDKCVAFDRGKLKIVDCLQMVDLLQGLPRKRRFPFKRVESHSFQQLAQGKVEIFGESFEDLQKTLLHAHAGLTAFNLRHTCCYYFTTVTKPT